MSHSTPERDRDGGSEADAVDEAVRESIRQLADGEAITEDELDDALLF